MLILCLFLYFLSFFYFLVSSASFSTPLTLHPLPSLSLHFIHVRQLNHYVYGRGHPSYRFPSITTWVSQDLLPFFFLSPKLLASSPLWKPIFWTISILFRWYLDIIHHDTLPYIAIHYSSTSLESISLLLVKVSKHSPALVPPRAICCARENHYEKK